MHLPTVHPRRSRPLAAELLLGTALGCSLLVLAVTPAAADPCGPPSPGGALVCVAIDEPITATAGAIIATEDDESGVEATLDGDPADNLDVSIAVDSITTSGDRGHGVSTQNDSGDVVIDAGSISTSGADAYGVYAEGIAGKVHVGVDSVTTSGSAASGLIITANGSIDIDVGSVSTAGRLAHGIFAIGLGEGPIDIEFGSINTEGQWAEGVYVSPLDGGPVSIKGDSVATKGDAAIGVHLVDGAGDVAIVLDSVTTSGADSSGIMLSDIGRVDLDIGSISTSGDRAVGVMIYRDPETSVPAVVTVKVGSASTGGAESGAESTAIQIANAGETTVNVHTVATHGAASSGIVVNGQGEGTVHVTATGLIETHSDHSNGVFVQNAETTVLTLADISTEGFGSSGVYVHASDADILEHGDVTVSVGDITTNGRDARGLWISAIGDVAADAGDIATQGDTARAVQIFSNNGLIDARVGDLHTDGTSSGGLLVGTNNGDIILVAGDVRTDGAYSEGATVNASGDVNVTLGAVTTTGEASDGLRITRAQDVILKVDSIRTASAYSNGVMIEAAGDIAMNLGTVITAGEETIGMLASAASISMTVNGELRGATRGAWLTATDTLAVTLGTGASASGAEYGLHLTSADGATVTNRGSIRSTEGIALNVDGGAATIDNHGELVGRIDLTDAVDTLHNAGTFRVAGDSDFGGAIDTLHNTGLLIFADSSEPTQARLRNLERFNNGGVIDLANGVAGDVLTIDGVLNGQAGNEVRLDLDTRAAVTVVDRLVVGSLEGVTHIDLAVQGAGVVGDTGVTLVTSGVAQTGQELDVTTAGGFLDYDAVFDVITREYRIVGAAAAQAWEPTKVASGAQTQWRRGADVVSARFDDLRDSRAMGLRQGGGAQAWAQAFGGTSEVDGARVIDGEAVDLTHDVDAAGGQVGVDIVRGFGGGGLIMGLTGGVSETELTFQSNGDQATFTGFGLGAYAQWSRGPVAVGILAKGDSYELQYEWGSADLSDEASGNTFGIRVDAAWRIDAGAGWTFEPQASASWTKTHLGSISAEAGEVEFGGTASLIGKAGVRLAHAIRLSNGALVQPFVGVYGFNEFDGDNASRIHVGSQTIDVADAAADQWSEAVFGVNLGHGPIQGFVQGEAAFGEIRGFTARLGARLNW